MDTPVCTIIAGPNGAGKTTFALKYLPEVAQCRNFVNADLIAAGLAPFNPESEALTAGRMFLKEVNKFIERRESFAFETTLAGKSYLRLIRKMLAAQWKVNLIYLYLPNVEMSISRVAERVKHGGHDIPLETIKRRYPRSVRNLLESYAPLCTSTVCVDNTVIKQKIIFSETPIGRVVIDEALFVELIEGICND